MKNANTLRMFLIASVLIAGAGCTAEKTGAVDTSGAAATVAPAAPTTAPAAPAATTATPAAGMVDPNTASQAELASISGMNDSAAEALIAGRPYANMVAVNKALSPKLSKAQRDSIYARLWIPIDLNTATGEEILLIPGVGPRMRHEFEEYRPYKAMDQFHREIGKYVDKDELARLERYVTIR